MTATASRASAAGQAGRPRSDPAWLTDGQLTARLMSPPARCAAYGLNPEDWFPIATGATIDRHLRASSAGPAIRFAAVVGQHTRQPDSPVEPGGNRTAAAKLPDPAG